MKRLPRAARGLRIREFSGEALVFHPLLLRTVALDAAQTRVLRLCLAGDAIPDLPHLERTLASLRAEGLLAPDRLPARRRDLVLQPLGGEILAMDPATQEVHHLNPVAARVLERCDGVTPVEVLVAGEGEAADDALWMTLDLLQEKGLLEPAPALPAVGTRRAFLARWGKAAAMLPVIASLAIPAPASAQSVACFQGAGGCQTAFPIGTRLSTCMPCCLVPPCSCSPGPPAVFCMTGYSTTGTNCTNDAVTTTSCEADLGGFTSANCTLARTNNIAGAYFCCQCPV